MRFEVISDGWFRPTPGILRLESSAWKRVNHPIVLPNGGGNSHMVMESRDRICKKNHHLKQINPRLH